MKIISTILFLILAIAHTSLSREILSWVPPYSVEECYGSLNADFGTCSPKNVLTGLGLQFWRPTSSGGLVYEKWVSDDEVIVFRTKCKQYGIKLLLCVYNNNQTDPGWDWNLARSAFRYNRTNFVNALYNECKRLDLDGVDIDLEGLGNHDNDRQAFAQFIKELYVKLHGDGLIVTIDSFHSPCYNAPNMAWWEDWAGCVDHIHTMGYSQVWESNTKTLSGCPSDPGEEGKRFFKYSYQSRYGLESGLSKTVVSSGVPSSSRWGDGYVREHLQDILNLQSPTGVCIWDFTLGGNEWQKSSTWELAKKIRDLDPVTPIASKKLLSLSHQISILAITDNQVRFSVAQEGRYSVSLYTISGKLKKVIANKNFTSGLHSVALDKISKGVYILTFSGNGHSFSSRIILNKRRN